MARNQLGNGVVIKAWRFIIDLGPNIDQPKRKAACTLVQSDSRAGCARRSLQPQPCPAVNLAPSEDEAGSTEEGQDESQPG